MAEDSTFELSKDQLDLLVIPPHLIVNKIIIASREDKKSISRLKKKKKSIQIIKKWYMKIWYGFSISPNLASTIERQFSGEHTDILSTAQSIIDSIKSKAIIVDPLVQETPDQRSKRGRSASEATPLNNTQGDTRGGQRTNAGRPRKKDKMKKCKRSLRKNKKYRKHKRRMRYAADKQKLVNERRQNRQATLAALRDALNGCSSLEVFLVGDKKWAELSEFQHGRLYRQVFVLCQFYEALENIPKNQIVSIEEVRQTVCLNCPFDISPETLGEYQREFVSNGGKFSEHQMGKWEREWILDQSDLKLKAVNFLNHFNEWKELEDEEYLTVEGFKNFLNEELLKDCSLQELKGLQLPISWETARIWMARLGFGYKAHSNDVYSDGHDRADVCDYKAAFLPRMQLYQDRSHLFFRTSLALARDKYRFDEETIAACTSSTDSNAIEIPIDNYDFDRNSIEFGGDLSINLEGKPSLIFVQDEAIFKSFDGAKKYWSSDGKKQLRSKGEGKGIMASAFLNEQLGFFSISREQFDTINNLRQQIGKHPLQYFTEYENRYYSSLYLFEYGKNREGYWGGDDMLAHTDEFIDVLEFVFGDRFQFVFLYDWSSGHAKFPPGALNVNTMNMNFGGKQELPHPARIMEDYVYPVDFPLPTLKAGDVQYMVFQPTDPPPFYRPDLPLAEYVGKAKGIKQVLYERGLWKPGMTENGPRDGCDVSLSAKYILSQCQDFKQQKSQLQILIEQRGHICDFLPKYHPELSALERCWGMSKRWLRRVCRYSYDNLVKKVPTSLIKMQSLKTIRNFFRKCRDYQKAYSLGLKGLDVGVQLKIYKSHRMPPPHECTHSLVKNKPFDLKKKKALEMKNELEELLQFFNSSFLVTDSESSESTAGYDSDHISELVAKLQIAADDSD